MRILVAFRVLVTAGVWVVALGLGAPAAVRAQDVGKIVAALRKAGREDVI